MEMKLMLMEIVKAFKVKEMEARESVKELVAMVEELRRNIK